MNLKNSEDQTRAAHKVTLAGALVNGVNAFLKVVVGMLGNSQALVADGIHSLSDLLSDVLVLITTHYGRQQADENHPYGHGRFETMGTLILGGVLIAVAGALAWDGAMRLVTNIDVGVTQWWVVLVILFSIASKEWIYRYTLKIANRIQSDLLRANAWHHRTDSLSSLVVLVALIGMFFGYPWLDQLATVIVGMLIAKVGIDLIWSSLKELVDTALPEEQVEEIRRVALTISGVRDIHDLRSRTMGPQVLLDMHIVVSADLSVSEGHEIGLCTIRKLREHFPTITDINFHIDPAHRPEGELKKLPLRQDVLNQLELCWQDVSGHQKPRHVMIHYIDNAIEVDLFYGPNDFSIEGLLQLQKDLQVASSKLSWLRGLRLWLGGESTQ